MYRLPLATMLLLAFYPHLSFGSHHTIRVVSDEFAEIHETSGVLSRAGVDSSRLERFEVAGSDNLPLAAVAALWGYSASQPIGPVLVADSHSGFRESAETIATVTYEFGVEPVVDTAPLNTPIEVDFYINGSVSVDQSRFRGGNGRAELNFAVTVMGNDEPALDTSIRVPEIGCITNCQDSLVRRLNFSLLPQLDNIRIDLSVEAFADTASSNRSRSSVFVETFVSDDQMIHVDGIGRPASSLFRIDFSPGIPEPPSGLLLALSVILLAPVLGR